MDGDVTPRSRPLEGTPSRQPGRAARLQAALDRDGSTCIWCGRTLGVLVPATTEHVVPRVKGGPSWAENEVAACRRCNSARGHLGPVDWLEECRRRGWHPDAERLSPRSRRWPTPSSAAAASAGRGPTWTPSCAGWSAAAT